MMLTSYNNMFWFRVRARDAIRRRVHDERGATMVEYALLFALIVMVCIGAMTILGTSTGNSVSRSADSVAAAG